MSNIANVLEAIDSPPLNRSSTLDAIKERRGSIEAEVASAGGVAPVHHPVADLVRMAGAHGLVSTVAAYGGIIDETSPRWEGGFTTTVDDCCDAGCVEPCEAPPTLEEPDGDEPVPADYGRTEIIYHRPTVFQKCYVCTARQAKSRPMRAISRRRLAQSLPGAIEAEVATGAFNGDVNAYLAAPPVFDEDTGKLVSGCQVLNPVDPDTGLIVPMAPGFGFSTLNATQTCCGQGGKAGLHIPTQIADRLGHKFDGTDTEILTTKVRQNVVYSYECLGEFGPVATADTPTDDTGAPVSCDGVGAIPTGNPNLRWMFATGLVFLRLGPVDTKPNTDGPDMDGDQSDGFDKDINRMCYCSTRTVGWVHDGCCCAAVLVDVCGSIE